MACLGAIEQLGWPLDRIIHAEVWATDDIPADLPPMVSFKNHADKIIRERFGIEVEQMAKHESIFDWTIGEIEEVCRKSKSCRNCEAREVCESIQVFAPPPGKWKLGKPRFTEEEIDTCRLLQKLYPGSIGIARGNNRRDFVVYGEGDRVLAFITSTAFGNLKIWENARFSDVLGNSL